MRTNRVLAAIAAMSSIVIASALTGATARASSSVSPMAQIGPKAIEANEPSPTYGLFTCQLVGLDAGAKCYDPYQIRHAYNIDTLIDHGFNGWGRTIVIIDAFQSPNIVDQLNVYNSFYELPGLNGLGAPHDSNLANFTQVAPDGLTPFVPGNPRMTGWAEEISLDVLWAHAIAPGANIVLVLAKSSSDVDILSATKYAVANNLGDIISQSFGENESCMVPKLAAQQHLLFAEATLKNITLFASSGDDGAAQKTCDGASLVKAASLPAVDPLVSAVGGTRLRAAAYCLSVLGCDPSKNPTPGTYLGEVAWNEELVYGSTGGGFSILWDEPAYQLGTVHGANSGRGIPDVSYNASVDFGVLTYLEIPGIPFGFYAFGGTSAGVPQWAAMLAIADQKAGYNLGFVNTALYTIAQSQSYSGSFFDVMNGNNSVGTIVGFKAGPNWDPTTGLGSPAADELVRKLIQTVTPLDGLIAVLQSNQHTIPAPATSGEMKPH